MRVELEMGGNLLETMAVGMDSFGTFRSLCYKCYNKTPAYVY